MYENGIDKVFGSLKDGPVATDAEILAYLSELAKIIIQRFSTHWLAVFVAQFQENYIGGEAEVP